MQTGTVTDLTAPTASYGLTDTIIGGKLVLRRQFDANIESGVKYNYIYRDGVEFVELGTLTWGHSDFGDAAGSHPDELRFLDESTPASGKHLYEISQVNGSDLEAAETGFNYPEGRNTGISKSHRKHGYSEHHTEDTGLFTVGGQRIHFPQIGSVKAFSKP